jgi:glycosyltransferase involved in cell wall biosynthesis
VLYVYKEEYDRVTKFATASTRTNLGVEYDRFADPDDKILATVIESIESLEFQPNVAIYIGGLEPIYKISALLESIKYLDDWTLLVLGDGTLSSDVQRAEATRDDVVYLGTVPHEMVPGYLHVADVGVSLVDDPHTLKILEYAAAGLGIVQRAGRANQRFGEYVTYCEASPESIAKAIEQSGAYGSNTELQSYVSTFDWSEIADDYATTLTRIL